MKYLKKIFKIIMNYQIREYALIYQMEQKLKEIIDLKMKMKE